MTVQDMHIGVNLGVQRMASNIDSNLLKEEVDYYLNESVDEYIKSQYLSYKQKTRSKESDFVLENLRTLLSTISIVENTSVSTTFPNSISFILPNNFLYYIESNIEISGSKRNNILLSHSSIKKLIETKYNKPLYREYPIIIEGTNAHIVLPLEDWSTLFNNSTISFNPTVVFYFSPIGEVVQNGIKFTYIKKPAVITYGTPELPETIEVDGEDVTNPDYIAPTDCDLPTHTHKEIVNFTITEILNILNQGTKQ